MRQHKYNNSTVDRRRWNDHCYGSIAEMEYAKHLHAWWKLGQIRILIQQPKLWLGIPMNVYIPDFFVVRAPHPSAVEVDPDDTYFIDVKGAVTPKFNKDKRLWREYGMAPLHVVKQKGKDFYTDEVIRGGGAKDGREDS